MSIAFLGALMSQVYVLQPDWHLYFVECGIFTAWLVADAIYRRTPLASLLMNAAACMVLATTAGCTWCAQTGIAAPVPSVQHSIATLDPATHRVVFTTRRPGDDAADNAAVWSARGRQYWKRKDYRLAADQFHQALIAIDLISGSSVNIDSPGATLNMNTRSVLGALNLDVMNSHVNSFGKSPMTLGAINVTKDPTFYNMGDINITGNISRMEIGTKEPLRLITSRGAVITQLQPGVIKLSRGEMFAVGNQQVAVQAGKAMVTAPKDALFSLKSSDGMVSIKSCAGPAVSVVVGNKSIELSMGQEVLVPSI